MAKRKPLRGRTMTLNDGHVLEEEDKSFLRMVSMGNLPKVKETMEVASTVKRKHFMRLTDFKDRIAIEIATEVEHSEIVEYLAVNFVHLVDEMHFHECLMLAISKGYLRIAQVLLENPAPSDKHRRPSERSFLTKNNSKFDRDVTPLMLAAQCNEVDIIRLLLSRGEVIEEPHPIHCDCIECMSTYDDTLRRSLARLHSHQALASEAYICLTSPDPILTAFLLTDKLTKLAALEKEFKKEYRELAKQCKQFASDLLDMCQTTDEVHTILTKEATTEIESQAAAGANTLRKRIKLAQQTSMIMNGDTDFYMPRLELAIKYRQKQFVAHPHCQHHLATLWYKGTPSRTRQWPVFIHIALTLALPILLPVLALFYWFRPRGAVADFMRIPRTNFRLQVSMMILFLFILFLQSVVPDYVMTFDKEWAFVNSHPCLFPNVSQYDGQRAPPIRQTGLSATQILIMMFVIGMLWSEIKQIFHDGFKAYFASLWNWVDIALLNTLICSLVIDLVVYSKVRAAMSYFGQNDACSEDLSTEALSHKYWLQKDRHEWRHNDPELLADAFFAIGNFLSFIRMYFILPMNEFLGPLNISVQRMQGQIIKFMVFIALMFLAFFCSLTNLYSFYPDTSSFGNSAQVALTLIWALFGLGDREDVTYSGNADQGQRSTEIVGTGLYVIYHFIFVIVLLNMLIAMMATSFQEIHDDEDVEWKFARSKLWVSYFERGATLPPPLNVIPSPKSIYYFYQWLKDAICSICGRKEIKEPSIGIQHLNRKAGIRKQTTNHESLMKTVIKRYLFKLQNDKEGEEGGEGELEEIKNDISSFRCEVLETINKLTKEIKGGNGYNPPSVRGIPETDHRQPPRNDDVMDRWMASVEHRFAELTESFSGIIAHGRDDKH